MVALVDFRYLRDALTEDEALALLQAARPGRTEREASLLERGYPAYTTTPGWLGYDDEKLARLSTMAVDDGFGLIKLKVGANLDDDVRRLGIARDGGRAGRCRSPSTPTRSGVWPRRSSG